MSEPLTDEQLAEIREREQAATEGPWTLDDRPGTFTPESAAGTIADFYFLAEEEAEIAGMRADAAFVAHARTDVPALLAEVERLRARIRRVRDLHDEWASRTTCHELWSDLGEALSAPCEQDGGAGR